MKKFAKVLAAVFAVTLAAALMAVVPSAVTPEELTPGSNNILYISDDNADGFGTGQNADNPYTPDPSYGGFDETAKSPKYHLTTSFYQTIEMMKETGGTIVVCGPVKLGKTESYGSETSVTKDVFTPVFGEHTIKFTSVDPVSGVDYRETKGAKIMLESPAEIVVQGQSIWENIDIETAGDNRIMAFCGYSTLIGEGFNSYPADEIDKEMENPMSYVSLVAGHRYSAKKNNTNSLTVKSGTFYKVAGSMWGVISPNPEKEGDMKSYYEENATVNLVLEGTTKVLGEICGTIIQKSLFSGNVNITINSGTYACDINLVGPTGMYTTDGKVALTINGGDFTELYSLNAYPLNISNNLPAAATLNCANFNGDAESFYGIYNTIENDGFTEVVWPATLPEEPVKQETPTPVTEAPDVDEPKVTEAKNDNKAPAKKDDVKVDGPDDGISPAIIAVIVVVAVVVIGAVVAAVIVMKKKKAAAPADKAEKKADKKEKK